MRWGASGRGAESCLKYWVYRSGVPNPDETLVGSHKYGVGCKNGVYLSWKQRFLLIRGVGGLSFVSGVANGTRVIFRDQDSHTQMTSTLGVRSVSLYLIISR